jgi:hypothetical protein
MRHILVLLIALAAGACGSSGSDEGGPVSCTNNGQKDFVLAAMRDWYLWNDRLPADVDPGNFATPESLLAYLASFSPDDGNGNPVDTYSFINSAQADAQFFGEGKYEGFGFSWRFEDVNEVRLSRVFTDSPAFAAGLARGQAIVALDGRSIAEIEAAEGVSVALNSGTLDFTMREVDGTEFTVTITQDVVTIAPVPQWRRIPRPAGPDVGYIELAQFVSTADPAFDAVFADFRANGVNDVILDLRYNGGGLVSTAELLGDYLGGDVAANLVFSDTRFNADRAAANDRLEFFERLGNSMSLSRLVVVATRGTASASELVTNGMAPHVEVAIVGDSTFGKPVGQVGFEFCEKILRPTAFQTFNADGFGDYFDGLPATCAAEDDLDFAVGADDDPNMVAALGYLDTGACPAAPALAGIGEAGRFVPQPERRGPPWRVFAGAY